MVRRFALVARHNVPPAFVELRSTDIPIRAGWQSLQHARAKRSTIHIPDRHVQTAISRRTSYAVGAVEVGGVRTVARRADAEGRRTCWVQSLIYRQEVRPFHR